MGKELGNHDEQETARTLSETIAARGSPCRMIGQRIPRDTVPTLLMLFSMVLFPFLGYLSNPRTIDDPGLQEDTAVIRMDLPLPPDPE